MPLQKKALKDSSARFLAWLCCCPCSSASVLVACITCGYCKPPCTQTFSSICEDSPLSKTAGDIARSSISIPLVDKPADYAKLTDLAIGDWKPQNVFSQFTFL